MDNPVASESNPNAALSAYLERQGRNEYINLATQVGYDGANIAFVFIKNQVRRLMNKSPYDERKLEVLRAAGVGQPSEMVNLFCAPMKSMTTAQRIEKALDRLRQRYGVLSGLTSEPKVIAIRHGAIVNFTASLLKMYNEDFNTLEVFAYAHDEYNKLFGQLLLDTANRLPSVLKRRYLDFLDKNGISLNQPSFESLRKFVVHEINVTTSDYAQAFFKLEDKEKSREPQSGRSEFRVRQVALDSGVGAHNDSAESPGSATAGGRGAPTDHNRGTKKASGRPPICFVCARADSRHYLVECEKFMKLPPQERRQTVIKAGRCLNCLSTEHLARNCPSRSKCRKCGPICRVKHSSAIHDCYESQTLGAAGETKAAPGSPVASSVASTPTNNVKNVLKVRVAEEGTVLLRTSAVRVINQTTGCSTLAYAQHDTASQATLISDLLTEELGLEVTTDPFMTICTLTDQTASCIGKTDFSLESLVTGDNYKITGALVVPAFSDDKSTLPHAVDTSKLKHFHGVEIPVIPGRKCVDILIKQSDKALITVLKELEDSNLNEPNLVITRLGPIARGGRVQGNSKSVRALRVETISTDPDCGLCDKLQQELLTVNNALREYKLLDEEVLPSKNDELTCSLVEPFIRVVDGRYKMPVPFKPDVLKKLPNNYDIALKRTLSMRRTAAKNSQLKETLTDTFAELLKHDWIVPADKNKNDSYKKWYLPFFVTKTAKPRVVYDGAATAGGESLNWAVLAGENLLNGLVDVLMRFRMEKYTCVVDVSKCFFQIKLPRDQQDWFHIIWFKDNNVVSGEIQIFRFTWHVWGINSSPYVALMALNRLVADDPTHASMVTLNAITQNRYMDDLLLAGDTLSDVETFAREGIELFESRGFKLRKWVINGHAKSVLLQVPKCDHVPSVGKLDIGSQPLLDSTALVIGGHKSVNR